ncbi:trypsin-like peptidase domain-containing protein [Streptomyces sp. TS71-3]|uniref:trypsin-like peptidase domain-containing protein n=1 Tax=Streptomyces sp. TS71-3 TaxID=2733862 RepID=UPI001B2D777B|nr:trypsin-like peptidase domain-containing protein [Streptomyces sp. TS71-3]GHJ37989.1 hypothetical protein Sm713_35980 [Streptomyces sp. TS71-3]
MTSGVDVRRVAEIIVDAGGRTPQRGSGYRIRPTAVLTAAHVVNGARSIRVQFDGGLRTEWAADATVAWSCPEHDIAVLAMEGRAGALPETPLGGIPDDRVLRLKALAIGFPRFKLRSDDDGRTWYRDTHQADGSIGTASNRMQGTLEVRVAAPRAEPDGAVSPWEGMSGAALWCRDRIVGVLARHYGKEGDGSLTAFRVDRCVAALGTDERLRLAELAGTPRSGPLPPVLPPTRHDVVRRVHQAAVREDFAPLRLRDREEELSDLAAFCAGRQPYAWVQGEAWAGKTALLSWFVLNPPPGVEVASFFVTRRLPGAADGDAFTATVARQLSASADGESGSGAASHRRGWLASLFESAASRARGNGKVLLLVVDGLDEDSGALGGDAASIAALLPRHPPDNMRVLVSSRPDLRLPADVPGDHPLRACPVRELAASPHARRLEHDASTELAHTLRDTGVRRQVLGFVAAARGGLTGTDLGELTGHEPDDIDALLRADLGHSVTGRSSATGQLAYFLSHDTLQTATEQSLSTEIDDLRDRLHRWADGYRRRDWPDGTPAYLLYDYPNLLVATRDLAGLARCATDRARQDMLRRRTGNDFLAIAEIDMAYQLNVRQHATDLPLALRLALCRDELARRYEHMPSILPAVWARLGAYEQAESLARLHGGVSRYWAIRQVAETIAENGDRQRAEAVAGWLDDHATLAVVAEAVGDHERADRIALDPTRQDSDLLGRLSVAAEEAGDHERAELLARACGYPSLTARRALAAARCGDFARAGSLARSVGVAGAGDDVHARWYDGDDALVERAETLVGVAEVAAERGEHARARELTAAAGELARTMTDPVGHQQVLARLAAFDGDWDRVEDLVHEADEFDVYRFEWLVERMARAGEYDRAEGVARLMPAGGSPAWNPIRLVEVMAEKGDYQRAEHLTRSLPRALDTAEAFARLAWVAAGADGQDRARRFIAGCEGAMGSTDCARIQADGLIAVLEAVGRSTVPEDRDRARPLIRMAKAKIHQIGEPGWRRHVFERLVMVISTTGHAPRADSMLRSSHVPTDPAWGQCVLADEAARKGDRVRAAALLRSASPVMRAAPVSPGYRHGLGLLVRAATLIGEQDEAATVLHGIGDPADQLRALNLLTQGTDDADPAHVEPLARGIAEPYYRACALTDLALMAARAGAREHAGRLLREVPGIAASCPKRHQILIVLEMVIKAAIELDDRELARSAVLRAQELALREENGPTLASNVREILHVAAPVCDRDEIQSMIEHAEDAVWHWSQGDRDHALTLLVREVAHDARDHDLVESLAGSVSGSDGRAQALAEIAAALADAGAADRARAVFVRAVTTFGTGAVPNPSGALQALAKAADRIGDHDRADEFVSRLHSTGDRARALTGLVESDLAMRDRCTEPEERDRHARRATRRAAQALAAEVWTEIHWKFQDGTGPLTLAVRVDPRCVDALLEAGG